MDSETISLGKDPVPVSGISAALHSNADLALGTSTVQRISPPSESLVVTLNIASHLFTAFANNVAIDGETLTRNTRPITISGTSKLLGLDGLVVGALTVPLHTLAPESITAAASRSTCPPEWASYHLWYNSDLTHPSFQNCGKLGLPRNEWAVYRYFNGSTTVLATRLVDYHRRLFSPLFSGRGRNSHCRDNGGVQKLCTTGYWNVYSTSSKPRSVSIAWYRRLHIFCDQWRIRGFHSSCIDRRRRESGSI